MTEGERTLVQSILAKVRARIAAYESDAKSLVSGVRQQSGIRATTVNNLQDAIIVLNGAAALKLVEEDLKELLK